MWDYTINIHQNELLHTKIKESRIDEYKLFLKKMDNFHFLPNNILIRLFKELKKEEWLLVIFKLYM